MTGRGWVLCLDAQGNVYGSPLPVDLPVKPDYVERWTRKRPEAVAFELWVNGKREAEYDRNGTVTP